MVKEFHKVDENLNPIFNIEENNRPRYLFRDESKKPQRDPNLPKPEFPEEGKILTGVVKSFKTSYGFLLDSSNNEYFVHYSDIKGNSWIKNLARGQHVKFVGRNGPKGLYATDVELVQV